MRRLGWWIGWGGMGRPAGARERAALGLRWAADGERPRRGLRQPRATPWVSGQKARKALKGRPNRWAASRRFPAKNRRGADGEREVARWRGAIAGAPPFSRPWARCLALGGVPGPGRRAWPWAACLALGGVMPPWAVSLVLPKPQRGFASQPRARPWVRFGSAPARSEGAPHPGE